MDERSEYIYRYLNLKYQQIVTKMTSIVKWSCKNWTPYSRLMLVGDRGIWSIDEDMRSLTTMARQLDIKVIRSHWLTISEKQTVFFGSQFYILLDEYINLPHRIALAYFHGLPYTGIKEFDEMFENLCSNHERISRLQVSHSQMKRVVLESGIDPEKVFQIPIGINGVLFKKKTAESQNFIRERLKIPKTAFVIGSFQKDGTGWGDGIDPKLIKGPDVFLNSLKILKDKIPQLFILLTGPARGYVKKGIESLRIPYKHLFYRNYKEVANSYHALDAYIIASRQEGGPKAVLEAMASGVHLVTTRVGQAMDLVCNGVNGHLVEIEDFEGIAQRIYWGYRNKEQLEKICNQGIRTAAENTYDKQLGLWRKFFKGFVST